MIVILDQFYQLPKTLVQGRVRRRRGRRQDELHQPTDEGALRLERGLHARRRLPGEDHPRGREERRHTGIRVGSVGSSQHICFT